MVPGRNRRRTVNLNVFHLVESHHLARMLHMVPFGVEFTCSPNAHDPQKVCVCVCVSSVCLSGLSPRRTWTGSSSQSRIQLFVSLFYCFSISSDHKHTLVDQTIIKHSSQLVDGFLFPGGKRQPPDHLDLRPPWRLTVVLERISSRFWDVWTGNDRHETTC